MGEALRRRIRTPGREHARPLAGTLGASYGVELATAVLIVALTAAGCGGGNKQASGGTTPSPATSQSSTTAQSTPAASPSVRQVTAKVGERALTGHCTDSQQHGPAIFLDSGLGGTQNELGSLEEQLARSSVVCAYDRAGVGGSDKPAKTPRPLSDLVADLDAFAAAAKVRPPYVLVGQSAGATVVFRYAQAHPEKVAGFVSMNPVPPKTTWLAAARKVLHKDEYENELAFYRGENEENVSFDTSERQLTDPLRSTIPYVVMFDEDCGGDSAFCRRVLPALTQTTKAMASVGKGGRFVPAPGAGHQIYATKPDLVLQTVTDVLKHAG